jgi:hypothetical protein
MRSAENIFRRLCVVVCNALRVLRYNMCNPPEEVSFNAANL